MTTSEREPENVVEIAEWLQSFYDELLEMEKWLHNVQAGVRERLTIARLASKPSIRDRFNEIQRIRESGEEAEFLSRDEFLERYAPAE